MSEPPSESSTEHEAASPKGNDAAAHATQRAMWAVVQHTYGSAEVLSFREVAVPTPGDDEVLIKVAASSLNAADWHVMTGEPYVVRPMLGLRRPHESVQGRDVAGRVEAVGTAVTSFRPGDEVFGRAGSGPFGGGAFAQFTRARADRLVLRPADLSVEQAAALPLAANTALQGLRDVGHVAPGQKVLVNGASGGVGTFGVQIAKALGAHVTGVCSMRNVDLVRSLGADEVVDYTRQDFTRMGSRFDVVLDLVGNHSLTGLRRVLAHDGTLVLSGGGGGRWFASLPLILRARATSPFVSQRLQWLDETPSTENLHQLAAWAVSGTVTAIIDRVYPLPETAEAMRYLVEVHARAKVVLVA